MIEPRPPQQPTAECTPDHLIDRTLSALRDVEPSATLERRVLAHLQAVEAPTRTPSFWDYSRLLPARFGVAAFAVLAVAAFLAALLIDQRQPHSATIASHFATPLSTSRSADSFPVVPSRKEAVNSSTRPLPARDAPGVERPQPNPQPQTNPQPQDSQAALALAETLAPSLVAPQRPLNTQEREITRTLRGENLTQLAEANAPRDARPDFAAIFHKLALAALPAAPTDNPLPQPPPNATQETSADHE